MARLLSGVSNVGNAVVHLFLTIFLYANSENPLPFFVKEMEEGLAGPIGLLVINLGVGLYALRGGSSAVSLGWNSFVIFAGSFIPMVWPRFLLEGLATWPYTIVFLWFGIFAFELTACCATVAWHLTKK